MNQVHYRVWREACLDDGTQTMAHVLDGGAMLDVTNCDIQCLVSICSI